MECKMEDAILLDCYISSKDGKQVADIGFIQAVLPVWPRRIIAGQIIHVKPVSMHKGADFQRLEAAQIAKTNGMRLFERTPYGNDASEIFPDDVIREYAEVGIKPDKSHITYFVTVCKPS